MSLTMWWPSPEALEDLVVEDAEHGFDLSAPDDTECGEWLAFWSQDEAHHKVFEDEFVAALTNYCKILDTNGKDEKLLDRGAENRVEAQDDQPGLQPGHEPGAGTEQPS